MDRAPYAAGSFPIVLACVTMLAATGCNKHATAVTTSNPGPSNDGAKFDACALLTNADIESLQKSPITATKASGQANRGLQTSQCFYTATEFSRSVSLSVTRNDPQSSGTGGVRGYWEEVFSRYENDEKEKKGADNPADKEKKESLNKQRGEEEEGVPPKKIPGVGDEAYWSGNRVGGALYVLSKKKNAMVRVSVGGADTEEAKIDKSKQLAAKALERL